MSNTISRVNRLLLMASTASALSPRHSHVHLSQINNGSNRMAVIKQRCDFNTHAINTRLGRIN